MCHSNGDEAASEHASTQTSHYSRTSGLLLHNSTVHFVDGRARVLYVGACL